MGYIDKIKLPDNKTYDIKHTIIPVIGTQTAATGSWTGEIDIDSLYDGLTIAYFLPYAGSGNATLNLTLKDGTTTGAINCYYNSGRLTTHYAKGSNIIMTYWSAGSIKIDGTATTDNRWVAQADYNTNTDTKVRQTLTTEDTNRPILLAYSANTTTTGNVDNISYRANAFYYNPSTQLLTVPNLTSTKINGVTIGKDGFILYPGGASYTDSGNPTTGFIKITLPVSWNSTMMKFVVSIFEYVDNKSSQVDYYISGYNYNQGGWFNCSAYCIGQGSYTNLPVKFGHDGSKCAILIGTASTKHYYIKTIVHDFLFGHNSHTFDTYKSGWSVSITTTDLATISRTIENTDLYPTTIAAGTSSDTNQLTLAFGTKYKLTAGGTNFIFTMPTDNNTNYYHTTGSWSGLTYTATNHGGAGALAFTIPTGTTSTTVAKGDHTHNNLTLINNTNADYTQDTTASKFKVYLTRQKYTGISTLSNGGVLISSQWVSNNYNAELFIGMGDGPGIWYRGNNGNGYINWLKVLDSGNTSFTQTLTSGTKIGSIEISGTSTDIYAPTNTDTKVTQTLRTTNNNYPILLSTYENINGTTNVTNSVYRNNSVYVNTSVGSLHSNEVCTTKYRVSQYPNAVAMQVLAAGESALVEGEALHIGVTGLPTILRGSVSLVDGDLFFDMKPTGASEQGEVIYGDESQGLTIKVGNSALCLNLLGDGIYTNTDLNFARHTYTSSDMTTYGITLDGNMALRVGENDTVDFGIITKDMVLYSTAISADCDVTFSKTLYLSNTADVAAASYNHPALVIGERDPSDHTMSQHMEFDSNEIVVKTNASTAGILYLQDESGSIQMGCGHIIIGKGTVTNTNIIICGKTYKSNTFADTNPKIIFKSADQSQNVSLTFTDFNDVGGNASITLNGNQGGEYFIAPYIKATSGWINPSDRRLKRNIQSLDSRYLDLIKNLNPVSFNFKDEKSDKKTHAGFIAQEVQEAIEKAGLDDEDIAAIIKPYTEEGYYELSYTEFIPMLLLYIKDLEKQIKEIKEKEKY